MRSGHPGVGTNYAQSRRLRQNGRKVAGAVENSDDMQRLTFWIIDDQIVRIRMHNPEAKWQRSHVWSRSSCERRLCDKIACPKNSGLNAISRVAIVLSYKIPDAGRSRVAWSVN